MRLVLTMRNNHQSVPMFGAPSLQHAMVRAITAVYDRSRGNRDEE